MTHLFEYKFWAIQISAYIFFTIFVFFCMKATSIHYHSKSKTFAIKKANNDLYFILACFFLLVLVIFSSFRYIRTDISEFLGYKNYYFIGGNDTYEYRRCYEIAKGENFFDAKELMSKEFIFAFIFWVFSNLNIPFDLCLAFLNSIIGIAILNFAKFFDLRKTSILSILALNALYLGSFNTLRWSFNLILSIYFAKSFVDEKYKRCFLIMIFSIGFHFSAIVYMLPLIGIKIMKKNRKLGYLFVIICCLLCWVPSLLDISPFLIAIGRIHQTAVTGNKPATAFTLYALYLLNMLIIHKIFFKEKKNRYLFYLILFLMPLTFIELTFGLAYRFSYYAHPILYMHFATMKNENKKHGYSGLFFTICEDVILITIILKFYFGTGIESTGVPYFFDKYLLVR